MKHRNHLVSRFHNQIKIYYHHHKMNEQKLINFSDFVLIVSREIKFIFIFDNVSRKKNTQKKTERDGSGPSPAQVYTFNPYLYYLFGRIYYEFNTL